MVKIILLYLLFIHLIWFQCEFSTGLRTIAKSGCPDNCGNVTVQYPFGVGLGCSIGEGFDINCNASFNPTKPFWRTWEVINISDSMMKVKTFVGKYCYNGHPNLTYVLPLKVDLEQPFSFSEANNFIVVGCGDIVVIIIEVMDGTPFNSVGFSFCESKKYIHEGNCTGSGCGQTPIPKGGRSLFLGMFSMRNQTLVSPFNPCGYAFLGEEDKYKFRSSDLMDTTLESRIKDNVPLVLDWAIGNQSSADASKSSGIACTNNSYCLDFGTGYRCTCRDGYEGNPYLDPGCTGSLSFIPFVFH